MNQTLKFSSTLPDHDAEISVEIVDAENKTWVQVLESFLLFLNAAGWVIHAEDIPKIARAAQLENMRCCGVDLG